MREKLSSAFAGLAAGAATFAFLRWVRRGREAASADAEDAASAMVDEAGLGSFPASDPPSWTLGEDRDSAT
jgi:hypothetical protein